MIMRLLALNPWLVCSAMSVLRGRYLQLNLPGFQEFYLLAIEIQVISRELAPVMLRFAGIHLSLICVQAMRF